MLNSAPRSKGRYKQGLYIPVNKDKVLKLNNRGGLYYRSGLEEKMMIHLDRNPKVTLWGAECIEIPYKRKQRDMLNGVYKETDHRYYPDFYYEYSSVSGRKKKVVVEVKPLKQTQTPTLKENYTTKQLRNFEYDVKEYNKNLAKWQQTVEYCKMKGFEFQIITEQFFDRRK